MKTINQSLPSVVNEFNLLIISNHILKAQISTLISPQDTSSFFESPSVSRQHAAVHPSHHPPRYSRDCLPHQARWRW